MSYAGNPSLSSDIQKRVLGTFEQTLGLASEGSRQEALLGCDFVLRMDPQFEPARQLQERLRNSAGAVRVDDLLGAPAAADPFALDLPDFPDLPAAPAFGAPAGGNGHDLRGRFQALLDSRRHQELLTLAGQEQAALNADPELMRIAGAAQERMEAEPYVNKFLSAGREAARQGQRDEVARAAEKIRALDPTHPGIAELQAASAPAPALPAGAVSSPSFPDSPSFGTIEAEDAGFDLSLDEPDFGAGLPDLSFDSPELSFDSPSLDFGSPAAAPSLDPELVSAADFATSMSSGDSETDRRINELLGEGQAAYDGGDLQGAIDAWSRIFLIDIDHQEAARRIEQARRLKAESERQAEEVFHEGLGKIDAGDLEGAKQAFHRVLEIQPSYFAAREYLQQLESGVVPSTRPAPRQDVPQPALTIPSDIDLGGDLKEEILIPPDPAELAKAERQKPKAKAAPAREGRARKMFALVGSAVLVLALGGGAFVYLNKDRLFPNSEAGDPTMPVGAPAQDPIARAQELRKNGKTDIAIRQLSLIPPEDPSHARAQELIAEWKSAAPAPPPVAASAQPAASVPAAPPVDNARLAVLTAARQAYQEGSYLEAIERLEKAAQQGQLDPSDAQLLASARSQTEPLASQIDLVRQHEWEHALRDLWRLHEAEPGNRDVTRLMVESYYNMALRDLQRMDTGKAVENLREAAGLDPRDEELQRQLLFAQTYQDRPKDLLYRIYVKHLPLR